MSKFTEQEDPDEVYYNAIISHDPTVGNAVSIAQYTENRGAPLVNNVENFYITCGRLVFPAATIPLFIASLQTGTNYSLGQTIYTFTLKYGSFTSGQTPIIWQAVNLFANPGTGTVMTSLQSSNPYYYIYSFYEWCKMMNAALATAFTALKTAAGVGFPSDAVAPVFYYDANKQTIILQAQEAYYDIAGSTPIKMYFNNYLAAILTGFYFNRLTTGNDTNGLDNQMRIENQIVNVSGSNLLMQPYVFDPSYFSSVNTLQLISTLPANSEYITPVNPDYNQVSLNMPMIQQLNPFQQVIEDFAIDFSTVQNYQSVFIYNKTDTWRMISVNGTGALRAFNLSLYWTTLDGASHPLYILPGTSASLKIALLKKSLFNTRSAEVIQILKRQEQLAVKSLLK